MVKSYFLTYGAQNITVDMLGKRIGLLLEMKVELHSSAYVGDYVKCRGPQADSLTIESDKEGDGTPKFEDEPFCNYSVFVEASNYIGDSVDRAERNAKIKQFFSTIPELVLLEETVLDK